MTSYKTKDEMKEKETPEYHLADSDEEDPETVETRRSVKTVEKLQKHRFFINDKERRSYDDKMHNGGITEDEMDFKEDQDEELGHDPAKAAGKEAAKKAAL